jgi:dCMP deaminase
MAEHAATKSKDRSTKVGAVIVGTSHNVLSIGFNGFPRGVNDDVDSRHERPIKYMFTEHAERNAVYNAARHGIRLEGATLYLNGGGLPCADCARAVIQAGIVEVVSMDKPFDGKGGMWAESERVSAEMFKEAGVRVIRLNPDFTRIGT